MHLYSADQGDIVQFVSGMNIAGATSLELAFLPPIGAAITRALTGAAIVDAPSGTVKYTVVAGDFAVAGDWEWQLINLTGGIHQSSDIQVLHVVTGLA